MENKTPIKFKLVLLPVPFMSWGHAMSKHFYIFLIWIFENNRISDMLFSMDIFKSYVFNILYSFNNTYERFI